MKKWLLIAVLISAILIPSYAEASITTHKAFESQNRNNCYGLLLQNSPQTLLSIYWSQPLSGDKNWIAERTYDLSSESWGVASVVYENPEYFVGTPAGGEIIGDKIHLFFGIHTITEPITYRKIHLVCDNLTGDNWHELMDLDFGTYTAYPYSSFIPSGQPDTYLQSVYTMNGDNFSVRILKTADNGVNWFMDSTLYSGAESFTETSLVNIGNGRIIALARNNNLEYLSQSVSEDYGDTWSSFTPTNLGGGGTGARISAMVYDSTTNNVTAVWHDRGLDYTFLSETDADTVFNNPQAWAEPIIISPEYHGIGYPGVVKLSPIEYFITMTIQGGDKADIWQCQYINNGDNVTEIDEISIYNIPPERVTGGGGGGGGGGKPENGIPLSITPTSNPDRFMVKVKGGQLLLTKNEVDELLQTYTTTVEGFLEKYGMTLEVAKETAQRYRDKPQSMEFSILDTVDKENMGFVWGLINNR